MYNFNISAKSTWATLLLSAVMLSSCTSDFLSTNTDPNAANEEDLLHDNLGMGSLITQMEYQIYPCVTKAQNVDVNNYQKMYSLAGDIFSGFMGVSNTFDNSGMNNATYKMEPRWCNAAYSVAYQNYMIPWYRLSLKKELVPTTFAVGQILKVLGMHRITDMYGPIPYKDFKPSSDVAFTAQNEIYDLFFSELDEAAAILADFVKTNPDARPLAAYDKVYAGDFTKWIKLAHSLKLRLAMRIVYADASKAQTKAEEAIRAGVMEGNDDNALIRVNGASTVNPLYMICHSYNDSRLGATLETYLKGYKDPRLGLLFEPSEMSGAKDYNGVRTGIYMTGNEYKVCSKLNVTASTPIQLMTAAEVYFLKAEAALRGWQAGGSAQQLYEQGVRTAFDQPLGASQAKAGSADEYLKGTTTPVPYKDLLDSYNSVTTYGLCSVAWNHHVQIDDNEGDDEGGDDPGDYPDDGGNPDDGDDDGGIDDGGEMTPAMLPFGEADSEELLEKIITQKYIALYPDGQEAWSEFRRTGYPRVIPVDMNMSMGSIDSKKQVARLPYPVNIKSDFPASYQHGLTLLQGADNGGTKLWWDKKADKKYQK